MPRGTDQDQDSLISIPRKKATGIFIPFAAFTIASTVIGGGVKVYGWIEDRKRIAVEEFRIHQETENRIRALERWKCKMGGHPPESINWQRSCDKDTSNPEGPP